MLRTIAVIAVAALVAGCGPGAGGATEDGDGPGVEQEASVQAVATVYPLAWLLEEVAPDADVVSLAARGQDPHDMELTPQQRALLEGADVVAYLGDIDFQPQVERAAQDARGSVVSAAAVVGEDALRSIDDHSHDDEGTDDDHGHDDEDADDRGEEAVDPHLWFDARLMASVARAVADAFAAADPTRGDDYAANGERAAGDLESLAEEIDELLGECRHDEVVVSHEAYAYLLAPHGLEQHGISGAGGHSEASPRDVADLAAQVRDEGLPAVLSEPVEGRADAEAVATEARVELIEIYSLDIVEPEQADKGFPALLREQAQAVATAAGCSP